MDVNPISDNQISDNQISDNQISDNQISDSNMLYREVDNISSIVDKIYDDFIVFLSSNTPNIIYNDLVIQNRIKEIVKNEKHLVINSCVKYFVETLLTYCNENGITFDNIFYDINDSYSESYTNATPFQAWRAGFREGVKMSLDQGAKVSDLKQVWWQNYQRLLIWMSVGADVKNGKWAMYGARLGCYKTNCTKWDHVNVRDFNYLTDYWKEEIEPKVNDENIDEQLLNLGDALRTGLQLEIAEMDSNASTFFKRVYQNTPRIIGRKR